MNRATYCGQRKWLSGLLLVIGLVGCASMSPNYQQPRIELISFAPTQAKGFEQRFKIGLRIVNPNARKLSVRGLVYQLSLNGHRVVSGVSGDIPDVPAYGDVAVELEAGASLIGGAKFVYDLVQSDRESIDYELEARLDLGTFVPTVKVVETGQVSLQGDES